MTATSLLRGTFWNAGPLFTSQTSPQPMIPQRTSSIGRLLTATKADRVIPMGEGMPGHEGTASFFRPTREKTADERPLGIVDPLVDVPHHVVDRVFAPAAGACLRRAGRAKQRPVVDFHEAESRVGGTDRCVLREDLRGMVHAKHITDAGPVGWAARAFRFAFPAARS